jgi:hypothetical protein
VNLAVEIYIWVVLGHDNFGRGSECRTWEVMANFGSLGIMLYSYVLTEIYMPLSSR